MNALPPLSRFLPDDFDSQPIGLIAGQGRYPILVAEKIREAGVPLRLVSFADETEPALIRSFSAAEHRQARVGQLGKMIGALRTLDCRHVLMAGQITPRRLFKGLRPDLKILKLLNGLKVKNAETIFGAIADEIEAAGMHTLDARAFLDEHLATPGHMTSGKQRTERHFIEHGIRIARGIAALDVGQSCVVRKGTVLAVEAFEGTDAMLRRAGTFQTNRSIFVKTVKPAQDYRFDVPVFGSGTLRNMRDAGIDTAVLEAGRVIVLDKPEVVAEAEKLKIELYGFELSD